MHSCSIRALALCAAIATIAVAPNGAEPLLKSDGHTVGIALRSAPRTKILLIGHAPDHPTGTHMYLPECHALAKDLARTPGVDAAVSDGWPRDPKLLQDVRAIVLYSSPGAKLLLSGPHSKSARGLLHGGVGLTAIHWATGAEGDDLGEQYLRMLGGYFSLKFGGLDVSSARVRQLDHAHPICRGWTDFNLRDEWYLRTRIHPKARPLLSVRVKDHDQIVAWTFERPNSDSGRSFGITLGHFHDNFGNETFRRLIVNGILWTAHLDIPQGGAPLLPSRNVSGSGPRAETR